MVAMMARTARRLARAAVLAGAGLVAALSASGCLNLNIDASEFRIPYVRQVESDRPADDATRTASSARPEKPARPWLIEIRP